ncbi:MAG: M1 family aminopeptidase, partial [Planctomycetota bacterium]
MTIRDFTAGGMENTTLTTLTHRTIFSPVTEDLLSSRQLDAHELAHQWFGDYVTCEDWSQLWLNEGFATYYTHLYEGHKLGRDELLYRLHRDAATRILTAEDDTRPIVFRGYKTAWEQFDFRAYPKGAWVLHMLRTRLGPDVYRTAVRRYLEKHALSSVVTADLVAELEDASGLSLDRFFDQWVYHGGVPKLKVRYKWLPKEKLARVTVEQTHEVSDDVLLFHLPTTLRFVAGGEVVDHEIVIDRAKHEFFVPLPSQPSVVVFDPELAVLAELDFDKPQAMLEAQLVEQGSIIGRLRAAAALGDKESKRSVAALAKALQRDPHYAVRMAAADALGKLQTDEAFAVLAGSLDPSALRQPSARVRQRVVMRLGEYYRPDAEAALVRVAREEPNPGVAAQAVKALGLFQTDAARAAIEAALAKPSLHERYAGLAFEAAERRGDPALLPAVVAAIDRRGERYGSRTWTAALTAVARLAATGGDKTAAREAIVARLDHPKAPVRIAAIK